MCIFESDTVKYYFPVQSFRKVVKYFKIQTVGLPYKFCCFLEILRQGKQALNRLVIFRALFRPPTRNLNNKSRKSTN